MKKPWQIWSLYLVCLMAVCIAMSWLSLKTVRLDALRETDRAETELARREAELQERISSPLYRMDLRMLPIVTQEAARPVYLYQSFYGTSEPTGLAENAYNRLPAMPRIFSSRRLSCFIRLLFRAPALESTRTTTSLLLSSLWTKIFSKLSGIINSTRQHFTKR